MEKTKEKLINKLRENNKKEREKSKDKTILFKSKSYKDTTKLDKKIQFKQDYLKNFKFSNKAYDEPVVKQQQSQKKGVVYQGDCDCDECVAERKELEAITKRNNVITNIKSINEDVECDCDDCRREKKAKLVKSKSFNVKSYTPTFGPPAIYQNKRNSYLKKDDNDECNCETCLIDRKKYSKRVK
jgi:hypothetical protein